MAEIEQLTPTHRILPTHPGTGAGRGNEAPQRKPKLDDRQRDHQRRRKSNDGDTSHIDEYA